MSTNATGGPAFPVGFNTAIGTPNAGMALRDYFAAAALAKIIDGNRTTEEIARLAYVLADAMLIARQA